MQTGPLPVAQRDGSHGFEEMNLEPGGRYVTTWLLVTPLVALALSLAASVARAVDPTLSCPNLVSLQFPSTWSFFRRPESAAMEFGRGPDAEHLTAQCINAKTATSGHALAETADAFAKSQLATLATSTGQIVRALTVSETGPGRLQYSLASESQRDGAPHYLLQYLLVSSRGFLYITVDGPGNASEFVSTMDGLIAAQRWLK